MTVKLDACVFFIFSGLVAGVIYTLRAYKGLQNNYNVVTNEYNNQIQPLLNNQTCAQNLNGSMYDWCRGLDDANNTVNFTVICNSLLTDICVYGDTGLPTAVATMGAIAALLLVWTGYRKYKSWPEISTTPILYLSARDRGFLQTQGVLPRNFFVTSKAMPPYEFNLRIFKQRLRLSTGRQAAFVSKDSPGEISKIIASYLGGAEEPQFLDLMAIKSF